MSGSPSKITTLRPSAVKPSVPLSFSAERARAGRGRCRAGPGARRLDQRHRPGERLGVQRRRGDARCRRSSSAGSYRPGSRRRRRRCRAPRCCRRAPSAASPAPCSAPPPRSSARSSSSPRPARRRRRPRLIRGGELGRERHARAQLTVVEASSSRWPSGRRRQSASKPTVWVPQDVGLRMNPWGGVPTRPAERERDAVDVDRRSAGRATVAVFGRSREHRCRARGRSGRSIAPDCRMIFGNSSAGQPGERRASRGRSRSGPARRARDDVVEVAAHGLRARGSEAERRGSSTSLVTSPTSLAAGQASALSWSSVHVVVASGLPTRPGRQVDRQVLEVARAGSVISSAMEKSLFAPGAVCSPARRERLVSSKAALAAGRARAARQRAAANAAIATPP